MIYRDGDKLGKVKVSNDPNLEPDIEISYYPYYIKRDYKNFDPSEDSAYFVNLSNEDCKIDIIELGPRPLSDWPEIVDIIIRFSSLAFLYGFIGKSGADLYDKLKEKISLISANRKNKRGEEYKTGIHLIYRENIEYKNVLIKLAVKVENLSKFGDEPYNLESIQKYVKTIFHDLDFSEVLIALDENEPFYKVIYFRDSDGKYHRINKVV